MVQSNAKSESDSIQARQTMSSLRGRRSKGFLGGLLFGIGKETCKDYLQKLQQYEKYLAGEFEASETMVGVAESVANKEVGIAENTQKVELYATYAKAKKQVIEHDGKKGRQEIASKPKKALKKQDREANELCTLAQQLTDQIK